MSKSPKWLLDFKRNVYSQSGEDGVIEKILDLLPDCDNWCVEFGAWDGKYLCNVRNLIENKGYSSVLIEASKQKFSELQDNYQQFPNVLLFNQFVGFDANDNLDNILGKTSIPKNFDFLSIDIDGNDFHVWKVVSKYRPKIVCIEYNPTIPSEIEFVQEANPITSQGSSILSIVSLAKDKGYELISVVGCNAIFVDSNYYPLFEITDNSIASLRGELYAVTHIFVGYDGKIFLRGRDLLSWHGVKLKESDFQILPSFLQKYPGNYSFLDKMFFAIYLLFREPSYLLYKLKNTKGKLSS
jgi:hypothetical protein